MCYKMALCRPSQLVRYFHTAGALVMILFVISWAMVTSPTSPGQKHLELSLPILAPCFLKGLL